MYDVAFRAIHNERCTFFILDLSYKASRLSMANDIMINSINPTGGPVLRLQAYALSPVSFRQSDI